MPRKHRHATPSLTSIAYAKLKYRNGYVLTPTDRAVLGEAPKHVDKPKATTESYETTQAER
jgi:hypothetical protein